MIKDSKSKKVKGENFKMKGPTKTLKHFKFSPSRPSRFYANKTFISW